MSVRKYSQTDSRWATKTIGNTKLLIGRYGCLLTAICMLRSRFYPKNTLEPPEGAKKWQYTQSGLLMWNSDFDGMNFKGRYYGKPTNQELHHWIRSHKRGMVLQVNDYHWVFAYYYPFSIGTRGLVIIDPLGGKIRPLALTNYKVTGYVLFDKKDIC